MIANATPLHAFTINPSAKIGLPHPFNLSLSTDLSDSWEIGVRGTFLSPSLTVSDVSVHVHNLNLFGRYYPWDGAFFVGAFLGKHHVYAQKTDNVTVTLLGTPSTIPVTAEGIITALYVGPSVGWRFTYESGFFFGLDLGVMFPFSPSTTVEASTTDSLGTLFIEALKQTDSYQTMEADVTRNGNNIGRTTLPYFTFLELGWRF